jgi:hypothetical protein
MEQWRQILNFSIFHISNKLSKFTNYESHQLWRIELKYDTKLGTKANFYILGFLNKFWWWKENWLLSGQFDHFLGKIYFWDSNKNCLEPNIKVENQV